MQQATPRGRAAGKRREVGPIVRVGPFGRRGEVRLGEIVFDRTGKLGEDPRVFPRDRRQRLSRRRQHR